MKKQLGQYFTTSPLLLRKVAEFVKNRHGNVLEPSCGAGHIIDYLISHGDMRKFVGIEIDDEIETLPSISDVCCSIVHKDFLEYALVTTERYATIVGNPPYVKRQNRRNIYIEFIDTCLDLLDDGGELVFIIPSDFFKLTSASSVKQKMFEMGSITHVFHPHDEKLFDKASQDVVVFRFEKGLEHTKCIYNGQPKTTLFTNGNIFWKDEQKNAVPLSQLFDIKVGMVSGADAVFKNDKLGNITMRTFTGERRFIYIDIDEFPTNNMELDEYMISNKEKLKDRRIRKFTDKNWFCWGCPRNQSFMTDNAGKDCIYCATITRKKEVFVPGKVGMFDGSLLCLLPKEGSQISIEKSVTYLNTEEFLENFLFAGRYKMGQKSLGDCQVPIGNLSYIIDTHSP